MSQNAAILARLRRGPLTPREALEELGCFRLAARIRDLRLEGHLILSEPQRYGGKSFARYTLIEPNRHAVEEAIAQQYAELTRVNPYRQLAEDIESAGRELVEREPPDERQFPPVAPVAGLEPVDGLMEPDEAVAMTSGGSQEELWR